MNKDMKVKKISLDNLLTDENTEVINQMYEVYKVCFEGWKKDEFIQYLVKVGARPSQILLIFDKNDVVGYNIAIIRKFVLQRKKVYVVSADIALLPKYRGQVANLIHIFLHGLLFKITHPFSRIVYVDIIMNYKMYQTMVNAVGLIPNPQQEIPEGYKQIIKEVVTSDGFKLEDNGYAVSTHDKIHYQVPDELKMRNLKLYQYFMEKTNNATYGLTVLMPGTYLNVFKGLYKFILKKIGKQYKRLHQAAGRN